MFPNDGAAPTIARRSGLPDRSALRRSMHIVRAAAIRMTHRHPSLGEPAQATTMCQSLSTVIPQRRLCSQYGGIVSAFTPHSPAPMMAIRESATDGWAMTEKEERLARDRAEIAARVASFRETQQKFERERVAYYETTLANAINGSRRQTSWR